MVRRFVFCAALIIRLFCRNHVVAFDLFPSSKGMDGPFASSGNFRGNGYSQQQSSQVRRPAGSSYSNSGFYRPVTEGLTIGNGWKDDDDDTWNAGFGSDSVKPGLGSGGSFGSNTWNFNSNSKGNGYVGSSNSGFGSNNGQGSVLGSDSNNFESNQGQGSAFGSVSNNFASNSKKKQVSGNSGKQQGNWSSNNSNNNINNNNKGFNQNGKKTWGSNSNGQAVGQSSRPQSNSGSNSWKNPTQSQTSKYEYEDNRGSSGGPTFNVQSFGQSSRPQSGTGSNTSKTPTQSQTSKYEYDVNRGSSGGSTSNPKKVQGTGGSNWNPNRKESPAVPEKKRPGVAFEGKQQTKKVDWDAIEKQNKESPLKLDTSDLWYPARGGRPRIAREGQTPVSVAASGCFCTDREGCNPENVVDVLTAFRSGLQQMRLNVAECALSERVCCALDRPLPEDDEVAEYRIREPSCGTRISEFSSSDIGENGLAYYGDFPWTLRVAVETDNGEVVTSCGASLLSQSVAVTTAGCALQFLPDRTIVVAGEWNHVTGHGRNRIQERRIRNVFFDPRFDAFNFTGDLALLALDRPLDTERSAGTVCVPGDADDWDADRCVVVGWVADEEDPTRPLLRKIDLTAVTQGKCRENTLGSSLGFGDDNFICGHMNEEEPCPTDAGSSLLCPLYNTDIFVQIGFLSEVNLCPNGLSSTATFTSLLTSTRWMTSVETLVQEGGDRQ